MSVNDKGQTPAPAGAIDDEVELMPTAKPARQVEMVPTAVPTGPGGGRIKGASSLLGAAGAASRPMTAPGIAGTSPRDRKNAKKASRLIDEAKKAMSSRRYKAAENIYDEAIALLDVPPPRLWIHRLSAASKASNHQYVADNYKRIRAMATSDEELAIVDHSWIDCLVGAGYLHEALQAAEYWSTRQTNSWAAIRSVAGVIHSQLGNIEEAIAVQKSILDQDPSHILARWHLALHQMEAGDLPTAFETYEVRWQWPEFPSERRTFDIPRWNGEALEGKRVLVWREQGIGDEIRFSGILPDLIATGAKITFECSAKLAPLFRLSFPQIDIRPERRATERNAKEYDAFDFEVPVGSLALFFRPTVAEMQAKCAPWLKRDQKAEEAVRVAMNAAPQQPIIGLCWRSSRRNLHRDQNYLKPEHLAAFRLLGRSGFICLQYDQCRDEVSLMQELGLPITFFSTVDQMNDLVTASQLTGACDLVISASTATAELSAGLGVPTVMFGRRHQRVQLGTDGVPWHPTTRYLPVNPDDPMELVKSILFNWNDIASWAEKNSVSGRQIDWRLSSPG